MIKFLTNLISKERKPSKRGFTLLELIVVIVVLGILAAIAIPTFAGVITRANDASAATTLQAVITDAKSLYAINQGSTPADWYTSFATAASEVPAASALTIASAPAFTVNVDVPSGDATAASTYVSDITTAGVSGAATGASLSKTQLSIGLDTTSGIFGLANQSSSGNCVFATLDTAPGGVATVWSEGTGVGTSCKASVAVLGQASDLANVSTLKSSGSSGGGGGSGGGSSGGGGSSLTVPQGTSTLTVLPSDSQNALSWTAVSATSTAPVTGYTLQRSTDSGATWSTIQSGAATTYTDSGITNGVTYYYQVAPSNSVGLGTYSSMVSATPLAIPAVPVGLTASPITGVVGVANGSEVTLTWTAVTPTPGTPVAGYRIFSSTSPAGPFTLAGTQTPASATSYTDSSVVTGSTYYYEIQSYGDAGSSALSAATSGITIIVAPTTAPAILTNSSSDGQASFTWSAVTATATSPVLGYKVQRYNPGLNSWTTLYTGTNLSYTDTGLTNGLSYTYTVGAYNSIGTGTNAYAYGYPIAIPATPSGLTATVSGSSIALSWTPVASTPAAPVSSYYIYRSFSSGGPFTLMDATGPSSASTYNASFPYVSTGQIYYFEISAVGSAGASAQSSPTTGVTITNAPTATPSFTSLFGSNAQIALSWTATGTSSAPITGYILQRSTTSATGPWSTIYSGASASYTDTGLTNGSGYYYHVAATNSNGTGPYSSSAAAAPLGAPLSPTPATQQAIGDSSTPYTVSVNWTAVPSVYSPTFGYTSQTNGYNVYSSPAQSGPYTLLATVTGQFSQSYTVTSPTLGSTYYFKVSSYGPGGESAQVASTPSSGAVVPSLPITAPTLIATAQSGPQVYLSWTSVASTPEYPASTTYELDTATSASGPWSTLAQVNATSYTHIYVDYGTTHYYRVAVEGTGVAYGGGNGPFSNVASATLNVDPPLYADTLVVSGPSSGTASVVPTYNTLNGAATNTYAFSSTLQYSTSPTGPWNIYTSFCGDCNTSLGNGSVAMSISGLQHGVTYYFRDYASVYGHNGARGPYSSVVSAVIP